MSELCYIVITREEALTAIANYKSFYSDFNALKNELETEYYQTCYKQSMLSKLFRQKPKTQKELFSNLGYSVMEMVRFEHRVAQCRFDYRNIMQTLEIFVNLSKTEMYAGCDLARFVNWYQQPRSARA